MNNYDRQIARDVIGVIGFILLVFAPFAAVLLILALVR